MRASISRRYPRALGKCDRCGAIYQHDQLQFQYQWAGPKLQNLRILVCRSCLDLPNEQLRTIVLPPDPVPIQNPRPEVSTAIYASLREDGGSALREASQWDGTAASGNFDTLNFELEESSLTVTFQQ